MALAIVAFTVLNASHALWVEKQDSYLVPFLDGFGWVGLFVGAMAMIVKHVAKPVESSTA
jgi:hypothetical protein